MPYTIPTWEISANAKERYRKLTVDAAVTRAECLKIKNRFELISRELLPSDLGLESWVTPKQASKTTATWINHQTDFDKVIALYKLVQLSETPGINEIHIHLSTGSIYNHQLQQLYGLIPILRKIKERNELELFQVQYGLENLRLEGWFTEPYIIDPSHFIKIEVTTGSKDTDGDELVLIGFVVEPIKL